MPNTPPCPKTPKDLTEPDLFASWVEYLGLKPRDLGVTPSHLYRIRRGLRRPSDALAAKLYALIEKLGVCKDSGEESVAAGPALVAGGGFEPALPYAQEHARHMTFPPFSLSSDTMPTLQLEQHMPELKLTRPLEELLKEFQEYVKRRYSPHHARNLARYVRLGLEALRNPLVLKMKTWRVAKYAYEALRVFDQFLRAYGYGELRVDWELLKKHLPRKSKVEFDPFKFEAVGSKGLVEQAIEMIEKGVKQGKWRKLGPTLRLAAVTAFFTGLRGTEIRYMFREWPRLEKISHAGVRIVHIGYDRVKKKAWITMMPEELAQILDKRLPLELGSRLDEHLRLCGVSLQFLRKAHVALLIEHLDYAEINLLQGRLSEVIVAHYIKHIREIAERYRKAVEPYIERLLNLLDTDAKHG